MLVHRVRAVGTAMVTTVLTVALFVPAPKKCEGDYSLSPGMYIALNYVRTTYATIDLLYTAMCKRDNGQKQLSCIRRVFLCCIQARTGDILTESESSRPRSRKVGQCAPT